MATNPVNTRPARPSDAGAIEALSVELRAATREPANLFTADVILRDGFGEAPEFEIVVAEEAGNGVVGYALFYDAYEPAYAAKGLYLADLAVAGAARRRGVGRRLIAAVTTAAKDRGRSYVWWMAQPHNAAALAFYASLEPPIRQDLIAHVLLVDE